jgi:hypothetical protein
MLLVQCASGENHSQMKVIDNVKNMMNHNLPPLEELLISRSAHFGTIATAELHLGQANSGAA